MRIPVLLVVLGGCATAPERPVARPLVRYAEKQKERGPSLEPVEVLKTWLAGVGDAVLRVPLTVTQTPPAWLEGRIGALPVELDDGALGVSLADRVRHECGEQKTCVVWVEGRWRDGTLHVVHFARAVVPDEKADFVERELP